MLGIHLSGSSKREKSCIMQLTTLGQKDPSVSRRGKTSLDITSPFQNTRARDHKERERPVPSKE
jgi:hypothetical protein